MRLALLASGPVGAGIVDVLGSRGVRPALLLLDESDPGGANHLLASTFDDVEVVTWGATTTSATVATLLRHHRVEMGLLAWWPRILRQEAIDAVPGGFLNVHPSLLPHCRGKDPNFWAIVEQAPFGVTLHMVDAGVDTGPVAFQVEIPVGWEDTGATLYARAQEAAVQLVADNLHAITAGSFALRPQDPASGSSHTRKELGAASRFELDAPTTARSLLNLLRARTFTPHPAARFREGDREYEVRVEIREVEPDESGRDGGSRVASSS